MGGIAIVPFTVSSWVLTRMEQHCLIKKLRKIVSNNKKNSCDFKIILLIGAGRPELCWLLYVSITEEKT